MTSFLNQGFDKISQNQNPRSDFYKHFRNGPYTLGWVFPMKVSYIPSDIESWIVTTFQLLRKNWQGVEPSFQCETGLI